MKSQPRILRGIQETNGSEKLEKIEEKQSEIKEGNTNQAEEFSKGRFLSISMKLIGNLIPQGIPFNSCI